MKRIAEAVALILQCEDEIFVIQRQPFLKTFPGYWAYPGGKVEETDEGGISPEGIDLRLWRAAVREGSEELGVDFERQWQEKAILRVSHFGEALTPDFNPYRFATHYLKLTLRTKPLMSLDKGEVNQGEWFRPQDLLKRYGDGEILVVPPVLDSWRCLASDIDCSWVGNLVKQVSSEHIPWLEPLKCLRQYMPRSRTLPPAERTNCFLIESHSSGSILVDPSPYSTEEMTRLLRALEGLSPQLIVLTHHHGDHHQHAPDLARRWGVPIALSQDTYDRLTKQSSDYFSEIPLRIIREGEVVGKWLDQDIVVVEVPGHDEGQIALMPEGRAWFIAGDLFQGVGTVVVGGEEGDMSKYMASLEKVIALNPKVIFPSHGIGLGGTYVLLKTLEHRRMREAQILDLALKQVSETEMLRLLYSEIPAGLHPYALLNIQSHIKKLQRDGHLPREAKA